MPTKYRRRRQKKSVVAAYLVCTVLQSSLELGFVSEEEEQLILSEIAKPRGGPSSTTTIHSIIVCALFS